MLIADYAAMIFAADADIFADAAISPCRHADAAIDAAAARPVIAAISPPLLHFFDTIIFAV